MHKFEGIVAAFQAALYEVFFRTLINKFVSLMRMGTRYNIELMYSDTATLKATRSF